MIPRAFASSGLRRGSDRLALMIQDALGPYLGLEVQEPMVAPGKRISAGEVLRPSGEVDPLAGQPLETMDEYRTVLCIEVVFPDLDFVVGRDTQYEAVKGGVRQLAEGEAVDDDFPD